MKMIVVGGAGFIGRQLTRQLLDLGHAVTVLDNFVTSRPTNLGCEVIRGNASDEDLVRRTIKGADVVFHLAAMAQTKDFIDRPAEVVENNIGAILGVIRALYDSSVGRFVYVSSSEVYGTPSNFPTPESAPMLVPSVSHPRWSYAFTKGIGELLTKTEATRAEIPLVIVRPHNIYGPGMARNHVIPDFIERMQSDQPFHLYGTGDERRCFCFVTDLVDGLIATALHRDAAGMTFNLGTNEETSMKDLALLLASLMGFEGSIEVKPDAFAGTPRRFPDIRTAQELLNFKPRVSLRDGLARVLGAS